MMATTHILTGAAVARLLRKPRWAWPAAAASYFVLDALPHVNPEQYFNHPAKGLIALVDAMVGLALVTVLIRGQPDRLVTAGGALACVLVGIVTNVGHLLLWFSTLPAHPLLFGRNHILGVAMQLLMLGMSVAVLYRRPPPDHGG